MISSPVWFVGARVSFADDFRVPFPPDAEIALTRPGDRHLTLIYLGRMPEDGAMAFWRALPQLALPQRARPQRWERFGRNAIALSLADDDRRLAVAVDACFDVAEQQNLELQRPSELRAHVTLGRLRNRAPRLAATAVGSWRVPPAPLGLGPPTLFRTKDDRDDGRYEVVAQQLGEPGGGANVGR